MSGIQVSGVQVSGARLREGRARRGVSGRGGERREGIGDRGEGNLGERRGTRAAARVGQLNTRLEVEEWTTSRLGRLRNLDILDTRY